MQLRWSKLSSQQTHVLALTLGVRLKQSTSAAALETFTAPCELHLGAWYTDIIPASTPASSSTATTITSHVTVFCVFSCVLCRSVVNSSELMLLNQNTLSFPVTVPVWSQLGTSRPRPEDPRPTASNIGHHNLYTVQYIIQRSCINQKNHFIYMLT